jgi:hypothetical protein
MNGVILVDLRSEDLLQRLSALTGPGGIRELGRALGFDVSEAQSIQLPIRMLILDPRTTGRGPRVSESIIARLLEVDPPIRALVALIPHEDMDREHLGDHALPGIYSFPHVKVIEMRGDRLSSVHEGNTAAATEFPADARWADEYRRDAQEFLLDPQTFDRTWEAIQQGQVVSLGIRVAGLGAGRDRAVADAALRLSTELDPLREPATGSELPDRWSIDNELLPVAESDLNAAATREEELHLPAGVGAIARVRKVFFTSVLKPSPERYNGVFNGIGQRLKERPERLATLLEATERRETDGTFKVHPVAAADLDAEFGGGVVYGDSYAKLYAEGRDASSQIEKMVRTASDYIGRGVAAAIPARWLHQDEEAVRPVGTAEGVAMLRDPNEAWNESARTTAADRPQGAWPAGLPLRGAFLAVAALVAFAAGVGEPQWPLLSWVALGIGLFVPAVLSPALRARIDVQLLLWGIAGFTVARLLIDPQSPTNDLISFPQSWDLHPGLRLAIALAGGLAAASAAAALVAFEAAAEHALPGPIGWILRRVFGGLRRLIAFVVAFAALSVVFNTGSMEVWTPSAITDDTFSRASRISIALVLAYVLARFTSAGVVMAVLLAWVLNPFSSAPFQPLGTTLPFDLAPEARAALVLIGAGLFLLWSKGERASAVKNAPPGHGLSAAKASHWIGAAKEAASPKVLVPDQVVGLPKVCHERPALEWNGNPEWSVLEACGESQTIVLEEAAPGEPVPTLKQLKYAVGEALTKSKLTQQLDDLGFTRVESVSEPLQYSSARGSISLMRQDKGVVCIVISKDLISEILEVEGEGSGSGTPLESLEVENTVMAAPTTPSVPKTTTWTPRSARFIPAGSPWRIPEGLALYLGSPVWASRIGSFLFLAASAIVVAALTAQLVVEILYWFEIIKEYPVKVGPGGIDPAIALFWQAIWLTAFIGMIPYLAASYFTAGRLREWIEQVGYADAARALARLEALARLTAQQEVARVSLRREYARTADQAAQLVEQAASAGSATAKKFGEDLAEISDRPRPLSGREAASPHREILGVGADLPGTDAAGIYRVYPHYTAILRRVFAGAMDYQVRERFARTRGEFHAETKDLIAEGVTIALAEKLRVIHRRGLMVGELEEAGQDLGAAVADELWADHTVRTAALNALSVKPGDPIPQLLSPGQARMLGEAATQFAVLPQPLVRSASLLNEAGVGPVLISQSLESAAIIRVTPFREGFYDYGQVRGPEEEHSAA